MKSSAPASSASAPSASKYSRGVDEDGRRVGLTPQLPDEAQLVQPRAAVVEGLEAQVGHDHVGPVMCGSARFKGGLGKRKGVDVVKLGEEETDELLARRLGPPRAKFSSEAKLIGLRGDSKRQTHRVSSTGYGSVP